MPSSVAPLRSASVSGGVLAALAVGFGVAFVIAPSRLASGSSGDLSEQSGLRAALRSGFVEYWRSGRRDFPSSVNRVVDYWFRYHVVKGVIAAVLLIVLVALGVLLWKAFLRSGGLAAGRQIALASSGVLVTVLALFSLLALMANIQGMVAPFSSLLPMLKVDAADGDLAVTLEQIRRGLADSPSADRRTPALEVMISDFALYHAAMAVIAAVVAVVLIGASVALWRNFRRIAVSDKRTRRVLGSFGVLTTLFSIALIVVVVANTLTAADSTPALLAFFNGGW